MHRVVAVLDGTGTPNSDTARDLAGAFQHEMVRDFLFRETITTQNGNFADVILGTFTGRPDWTRVDRAQSIAFELMKAVPAGQRAPMLTLMGWLDWLKGNGTQGHGTSSTRTRTHPDSGWGAAAGTDQTRLSCRGRPRPGNLLPAPQQLNGQGRAGITH